MSICTTVTFIYSQSYTRLLGALRNVGHELGRNTIKRILKAHGLEPAPLRGKRMPWKTFLKAHLGVIAAMDFFSVKVLTFAGLVRYHVLFVIDLATRRVQIAGAVCQPEGRWMKQVARNLTDGVDGFPAGKRYLVHDRDPLFTDDFRNVLAATGVKCLKLPAHQPEPERLHREVRALHQVGVPQQARSARRAPPLARRL